MKITDLLLKGEQWAVTRKVVLWHVVGIVGGYVAGYFHLLSHIGFK